MALAANKEEFERRVREAAKRCVDGHPLWTDLSVTAKLGYAMQAALMSDLASDEGQVAPAVTSTVAAIVDKFREPIINQSMDRAWKQYRRSGT